MKGFVNLLVAATIASSIGLVSAHVSAASHTNASSKPPALHKGVTVTVEDFFDQNNKQDPGRLTMERIAKAWSARTGVKIKFAGNPKGTGNMSDLCVAGPTGNGPDIIAVPHDELSQGTGCSVLDKAPAWAWPKSQQKKYIKAAVEATNIGGKVYGLPWAIETTGLWYNKALISPNAFKTSGNKPLAWSSLLPKLQKLNDPAAGKYAIGWPIDNFYFDYAFISNTGGYVFKYVKGKGFDYRNVGLNTAGAVRGIQFLKDMSDSGKYKLVPTSFTGNNGDSNASNLFYQGKMAIYLTGPWNKENMVSHGINFGFAPVPSLDGKHAAHPFSGVQTYAVNRFSKHRTEAWALVSYLTQKMQLPEYKTQGRIPVITSLLKSKTVQKDPVSRGLAAAAVSASPMPNIPEMAKVWTPMGNALGLVVKGQISPSSAAQQATTQIKSDIAKLHGG